MDILAHGLWVGLAVLPDLAQIMWANHAAMACLAVVLLTRRRR